MRVLDTGGVLADVLNCESKEATEVGGAASDDRALDSPGASSNMLGGDSRIPACFSEPVFDSEFSVSCHT